LEIEISMYNMQEDLLQGITNKYSGVLHM